MKFWQEYGNNESDCFNPEVNTDWFLDRGQELEEDGKNWMEIAEECPHFSGLSTWALDHWH